MRTHGVHATAQFGRAASSLQSACSAAASAAASSSSASTSGAALHLTPAASRQLQAAAACLLRGLRRARAPCMPTQPQARCPPRSVPGSGSGGAWWPGSLQPRAFPSQLHTLTMLSAHASPPASLFTRFPRASAALKGLSQQWEAAAQQHWRRSISSSTSRAGASAFAGAAAAAAASSPAPASLLGLAEQLSWRTASQRYRQYMLDGMHSLSPYWRALEWSTMQALTQRYSQWLPSFPGVARFGFHVPVLSALNLVGAGLPRALALLTAEIIRANSASAKAQAFVEHYAGSAEAEAWARAEAAAAAAGRGSWWPLAAVREVLSAVWHLTRLTWLLLVFAPVLLTAPVALRWDFVRGAWMVLLRHSLESAGAFFIKWGQWAATRHDIFPPDMCKELSMLHTQAPAHRYRHTKRALENAFNMPLTEVFESIDRLPVASGSIGQIHRATLSSKGAAITGCREGQVVAVKVRHPGTADTILHDFETMLWIAHVANCVPSLKHLRLEETLKQFAAPLKEQVDLAREASNLQRFNYNFRRTDHVRFPVPLYPLVSADVLVESFEEGDHITSYIESHNNPYNHRLSELGSGTMLQMMLVDNLIHSDLHPGNILVRLNPPSGLLGAVYKALDKVKGSDKVSTVARARIAALQKRWLQPQIVLLDVGMATEMTEEDQVNMVGLFRSFAKMDGRACGDWVLRFSGPEQSCPDPEAFRSTMENTFNLLKQAEEQASDEDEVIFRNNAEALSSVLEQVRLHQVSLPGHICAAVVTTLVLEGWSSKLDPDHSVMTQVQKMFEGANVPWHERILNVVDYIMSDEDPQACMA